MKRVLALLSVSCGLGLMSWGVGGCGSGSTTTTPDGFPLVGGGYRLKGDLNTACTPLFGDNVEIDITQDSSALEITIIEDLPSLAVRAECIGTIDKDANIVFSGTTTDEIPFDCSTSAIIEGSSKNDITFPLSCTIGDNTCEVVYGNFRSDGI